MTGPAAPIRIAKGWSRAVLDFLYPPACPLCLRRLAAGDRTVCLYCEEEMIFRPSWRCDRCGAAYRGAAPERGLPCRLCPPQGAAYRGVLSVTGYSERAARCVHLFKYSRRRELGGVMARLMARELKDPLQNIEGRIDRVAPVPLHWARRLARGFNQSALLARAVAEGAGLPCEDRLLRRVRNTKQQALIPRERRADNVKDAFAVRGGGNVGGLGILLIDDVVTSGHTIQECAKALRDAGAREVWAASFARAGMGRPLALEED